MVRIDPQNPAPPIEKIRVGMIGLGGRGRSLLKQLLKIPQGVEISVLADPEQAALDEAAALLAGADRPPAELRAGSGPAADSVCGRGCRMEL